MSIVSLDNNRRAAAPAALNAFLEHETKKIKIGMMRTKTGAILTTLAFAAALSTVTARDTAPNDDAVQSRIRALEQELQELKQMVNAQQAKTNEKVKIQGLDRELRVPGRKQDLAGEEAAAKTKTTPFLSVGQKGFSLESADGAFSLRFRSLVQADSRLYFGEDDAGGKDTFLIRAARIGLTGKLFENFEYRVMEEFAGSTPTLLDALVDWKIKPEFQVLAGKVKVPVGLERYQSRECNLMNEFGYPTSLVPNRDIGIAIHGGLFGNTLDYYVGGFNWVPDGGSSVSSADGNVNLAARLFANPFRQSENRALEGIGFGVAGTYGDGAGTPANYSTVGQRTFYSWRSGVTVDGTTSRLAPQLYYFNGPFGLLGEYAVSSQEVRSGANQGTVQNKAWEVTASWVLTGEDATFNGVKPARPVGFGETRGWGAWQVVARATELDIDDEAFPTFANPATSASRARSYGGGLNWYLNPMVRLSANYNLTTFSDEARPDENSLITRVQFRF